MSIEPDTKDWTWVLQRSCDDCGFDAPGLSLDRVPQVIRDNATLWEVVLGTDDAAVRPSPHVWSPLEYACHVRDVNRLFLERLRLMLGRGRPDVRQLGPGRRRGRRRLPLPGPGHRRSRGHRGRRRRRRGVRRRGRRPVAAGRHPQQRRPVHGRHLRPLPPARPRPPRPRRLARHQAGDRGVLRRVRRGVPPTAPARCPRWCRRPSTGSWPRCPSGARVLEVGSGPGPRRPRARGRRPVGPAYRHRPGLRRAAARRRVRRRHRRPADRRPVRPRARRAVRRRVGGRLPDPRASRGLPAGGAPPGRGRRPRAGCSTSR